MVVAGVVVVAVGADVAEVVDVAVVVDVVAVGADVAEVADVAVVDGVASIAHPLVVVVVARCG